MIASIPELLEDALAGRMRMHLSCSPEGYDLCFAAKPASITPEGDGITILPEARSTRLFQTLVNTDTPITGSFCTHRGQAVFQTRMLRHTRTHWLTETVVVEAGVLALPDDVRVIERRTHERFTLKDTGGIYASLLVAHEGKVVKIANSIWDISLGGVSFVCPYAKPMHAIRPGRTCATMLDCFGKQTKVMSKLVQVRRLSQQTLRFGLEFADPSEAVHTVLENVIVELAHRREMRHAHSAA